MKWWTSKAKKSDSGSGDGDCTPCRGRGGVMHGGKWVKCARCRGTGSEPN